MREVFSVGQIARIVNVAPRTVSKWFDSGQLRGYRIPGGSLARRIPRRDLIRFLREHNMPVPELEEEGWHKILMVGVDQVFNDRLRELLPEDEDYRFAVAGTTFEAGVQSETFGATVVIVDLSLGRGMGLHIAMQLRANPVYDRALLIALAAEDEANPEELMRHGFDDAYGHPVDPAAVAKRIMQEPRGKSNRIRKRKPFTPGKQEDKDAASDSTARRPMDSSQVA